MLIRSNLQTLSFIILCSVLMTTSHSFSAMVAPPPPVAIVDTGIDALHPFLKTALWENSFEIPHNQIDDDKNGYIDDIHGWDFVHNSPHLTDENGHGTHIAGIIHRLSPETPLMILKYYSPHLSAEQNLKNAIQAYRYAIQMKARIINFSGGGPGFNVEEAAVLKEAEQARILVVAAAGNNKKNTDIWGFYPAGYGFKNILTVAAVNKQGHLSEFSNFGKKTVDFAVAGENILSSVPGGKFETMSGTSQATAMTTGLAARVIANQRNLKASPQLIQKVLAFGQLAPQLAGKTRTALLLKID